MGNSDRFLLHLRMCFSWGASSASISGEMGKAGMAIMSSWGLTKVMLQQCLAGRIRIRASIRDQIDQGGEVEDKATTNMGQSFLLGTFLYNVEQNSYPVLAPRPSARFQHRHDERFIQQSLVDG